MLKVNEAWDEWLRDGTRRGCLAPGMVDVMVNAGFERALAVEAVAAAAAGTLKLVEPAAGPYQYPVSTVGTANRTLAHGHDVEILMRCAKPEIVVFGNVFTQQECDALIASARKHMTLSTVTDDNDGSRQLHQDRTSEGMFFQRGQDALIGELEQRVADLMQMPVEHGEGFQVLRYGVGAQYKPHFDYFPPQLTGSQVHLGQAGQRVSTMIVYLNDVPMGGETIFPKAGISVKAKRGNAVYFKYCNELSQLDPLSLHGGAPVVEGEKWAITKWVRQKPY